MIKHFISKIKTYVNEHQKMPIWVLFVFIISLISFGLGRLSIVDKQESLIIENGVPLLSDVDEIITSGGNVRGISLPMAQSGNFVVSKNSKYYYLPDCATAKRIKDENKVWFQTEQEAQGLGFVRGSGCFK